MLFFQVYGRLYNGPSARIKRVQPTFALAHYCYLLDAKEPSPSMDGSRLGMKEEERKTVLIGE